jgi:hypothetical protein
LARIGALVETKVQVCVVSLPHPPLSGFVPSNLAKPICASRFRWQGARRLGRWWAPRVLTRTRSLGARQKRI